MGVGAYMISCKDVREPASGLQREAGTRTCKLQSRFNGRRCWPLRVRCRRKKFTFAILSADEFLFYLCGEQRRVLTLLRTVPFQSIVLFGWAIY